MKEEWLMPGAVVPVDAETTATLVAEIKRLIDVVGDLALRQALAQPEQKPVAWGFSLRDGVILDIKNADFEHEGYEEIYKVPLYTAPPKREWVGLTDEESIKLLQKAANHKRPDYCTAPEMAVEFGRLASEALKEKNT